MNYCINCVVFFSSFFGLVLACVLILFQPHLSLLPTVLNSGLGIVFSYEALMFFFFFFSQRSYHALHRQYVREIIYVLKM